MQQLLVVSPAAPLDMAGRVHDRPGPVGRSRPTTGAANEQNPASRRTRRGTQRTQDVARNARTRQRIDLPGTRVLQKHPAERVRRGTDPRIAPELSLVGATEP